MQNIDFYEGSSLRRVPAQLNVPDPEYFSKMSAHYNVQEEKNRKRASRMIFLIVALCIISFTTGLVLGIKFAAGSEREIIDDSTLNAVTGIKDRLNDLFKDSSYKISLKKERFPKNEYPFVIKIGMQFNFEESKKIATTLSGKGHTVILTKSNDGYKVYTGPYRSKTEAEESMQKIVEMQSYLLTKNFIILKR